MATHGVISKLNLGRDDWSTWIEQLKFYFAANKVTDNDTKCFILLANVAPPLSRVWEHTLLSRVCWEHTLGVYIRWNGMVEWNSGMDYWNGGILHRTYLIIQHVLYSEQ